MITLGLLLAGSALAAIIAQWFRLPLIPFLVLSGILLGSTGLLSADVTREDGELLGLAVLMFVSGIEMNPRRISGQTRRAVFIGLLQFLGLGIPALAALILLGFAWTPALYIALATAASSTLVILRLLRHRQQFFEPFGRLVVGVLLVQDLLVILCLPLLEHIGSSAMTRLTSFAGTLGLLLIAWVFMQYVAPRLAAHWQSDEEVLVIAALATLFLFAGLAQLLDVPVLVGAFLGGVALSSFPTQQLLQGPLRSIAAFFLSLFFVSLGATVDLIPPHMLLTAAILVAFVVFITPPLVAFAAVKTGMTARAGIESGLLLSQCSEFSIIVSLVGLRSGSLDQPAVDMLTLVTVATMILTPWLATDENAWRLMRFYPARRTRLEPRPSGHVLVLGAGPNAQNLLDHLLQRKMPTVAVDDDPAVISGLAGKGIPGVRGDGADPRVLDSVAASDAAVILSNMRRISDNEALLRRVQGVPVVVRVFQNQEAERIKALGGHPISYSEAGAEDFIHWFDKEFQPGAVSGISRGAK